MTSASIWLKIEAPFAAFRTFTAGWYRPTAGFVTHSAAYGLLLNVAGIESRLWEQDEGHDGKTPATYTRTDLPPARLALGLPANRQVPRVQTVYQQLHNYPVNPKNGTPKELAKGRKNNITPVRRELLCDVRAVIAAELDEELASAIRDGLAGLRSRGRYGLPFLGDNSFLVDRLQQIEPEPASWYERIDDRSERPLPGTTRLTISIDRTGAARTLSGLFAPTRTPTREVPDAAWVHVGPAAT